MPQASEAGVSILSIDLDAAGEPLRSDSDPFHAQLQELRDRLAEAGVPVTWGLMANEAALGQFLLERPDGSEVALQADPCWSSEGSSRREFAEGLGQGVSRFAAAGFPLSTLLLPHGRPELHDDLIVKHGISMLRVGQRSGASIVRREWGRRARSSWQPEALHSVRWRLWEALATVSLMLDGERGIVRAIDRVSRAGGLAVIVAGANLLAANERLTTRLIGHFLRRRGDAGLRFETFASLAAARHTRPSTRIARSVLRPTAA